MAFYCVHKSVTSFYISALSCRKQIMNNADRSCGSYGKDELDMKDNNSTITKTNSSHHNHHHHHQNYHAPLPPTLPTTTTLTTSNTCIPSINPLVPLCSLATFSPHLLQSHIFLCQQKRGQQTTTRGHTLARTRPYTFMHRSIHHSLCT